MVHNWIGIYHLLSFTSQTSGCISYPWTAFLVATARWKSSGLDGSLVWLLRAFLCYPKQSETTFYTPSWNLFCKNVVACLSRYCVALSGLQACNKLGVSGGWFVFKKGRNWRAGKSQEVIKIDQQYNNAITVSSCLQKCQIWSHLGFCVNGLVLVSGQCAKLGRALCYKCNWVMLTLEFVWCSEKQRNLGS